jgi:hypothetical protein
MPRPYSRRHRAHFGSPISHQVRIETIRIPTVVTAGVAALNAGTRSCTGVGDLRSRVAVSVLSSIVVMLSP